MVSLSYWKIRDDSPFKSMVLHSKSINPGYDFVKHYQGTIIPPWHFVIGCFTVTSFLSN